MAKRLSKPSIDERHDWQVIITSFKDGRLLTQTTGNEDPDKLGESLVHAAEALGYDIQKNYLIKLSNQLNLKEDIRMMAMVILEMVK